MQHTDYTHLMRVRELLAHCDVPLETLNADLARERIRAANKQLDDYILPRVLAAWMLHSPWLWAAPLVPVNPRW